MKPHASVEVVRPSALPEALDELARSVAEGRPLRPMAGCTDLMVEAHYGKLQHERFLDLWGLRFELGELTWDLEGMLEPGSLRIGALATYADLLSDPLAVKRLPTLCQASSLVGATQIQARGTLAGNLENGSPAADAVPVLMALDAHVRLQSVEGIRDVPVDAYYTGYRQTVRQPNELITEIFIPKQEVGIRGHYFRKVGTRAFQTITKVGLAARIDWRDGEIHEARIVAISMAASIQRCRHIEQALAGLEDLSDKSSESLREAQLKDLTPMTDVRSTERYREEVFHRLVCHAVLETRPEEGP